MARKRKVGRKSNGDILKHIIDEKVTKIEDEVSLKCDMIQVLKELRNELRK